MRLRGRRADRGATAVETALVLPLLLMVVFAMIDFGRMLNAQIKVTEAAREGARALTLVDEEEADAVAGTVMGGPPGTDLEPGLWIAVPDGDCTVGGTHEATYEVAYGFEFVTPLTMLAGMAVDTPLRLAAKAVMPCRA
ncbi:TadE/TadG family type IV pilus assembly protein [Catenuloplanes atrovinosus]|uniref:TadE-like domain-containing protein n=1 Tax=Catenuloplanes atrovinosus TaxID=137266 RepID=A0AAE3YWP4_9ACTN|nr:TadE/TadG family type IV pilus assembly protein [Catenuloplanes atrovinosus]MDR7280000.1 hypothetical protein [Catenuloplanes atrovinosus]